VIRLASQRQKGLPRPNKLSITVVYPAGSHSGLVDSIDVFYKEQVGAAASPAIWPQVSVVQEVATDPLREPERPSSADGPTGVAPTEGLAGNVVGRVPHTYLDFDLEISQAGNEWCASVLKSPAGEATYRSPVPFSAVQLENYVLKLGVNRTMTRRGSAHVSETTKEFGERLFAAVFGDDVRQCFLASQAQAAAADAGLRVRLRLSQPALADIPWEYLYFRGRNKFLALSADTPLVRYLELQQAVRPFRVDPPLRVLVHIARPPLLGRLDVDEEWRRLQDATAGLLDRGQLILDRTADGTLSSLLRQIRDHTYHVFHFIGHGAVNPGGEGGALIFEDAATEGTLVSGQDLGVLMDDCRSLRLAVLNACEGARPGLNDAFAGAAQALVQQGIPAVVAMQFEISDAAAITFAGEFYDAVSQGHPIDTAVSATRKALFAKRFGAEWGTPVLYMRAPSGEVFSVSSARPVGKPTRQAAPPPTPPDSDGLSTEIDPLATTLTKRSQLAKWTRVYKPTIVRVLTDVGIPAHLAQLAPGSLYLACTIGALIGVPLQMVLAAIPYGVSFITLGLVAAAAWHRGGLPLQTVDWYIIGAANALGYVFWHFIPSWFVRSTLLGLMLAIGASVPLWRHEMLTPRVFMAMAGAFVVIWNIPQSLLNLPLGGQLANIVGLPIALIATIFAPAVAIHAMRVAAHVSSERH
jgi:hypothetical protein